MFTQVKRPGLSSGYKGSGQLSRNYGISACGNLCGNQQDFSALYGDCEDRGW